MRSRFDAAIVDLDGTMVDTLGDFEVAIGRALAGIGRPPLARDVIARHIGKGSEHLIRRVLDEAGVPAERFDDLWPLYQRHYLAINGDHAPVYPGVVEGLGALRAAGLRLACVTNKPTAFIAPLLAAKGLAGFFEVVYGGDAFARRKPDPLPVIEACRALGTAPGRTLVVGDSVNDVAASRAAGCPVVLVGYGYNHGEPAASAGADAVVDGIDRIVAMLAPQPGSAGAAGG